MVKIIVGIDGMACGMCEAHINEAVRAFVGAACRKREVVGGDGFFGRDDTVGKSTRFPHPFLGAGCDKPSIYGGNV